MKIGIIKKTLGCALSIAVTAGCVSVFSPTAGAVTATGYANVQKTYAAEEEGSESADKELKLIDSFLSSDTIRYGKISGLDYWTVKQGSNGTCDFNVNEDDKSTFTWDEVLYNGLLYIGEQYDTLISADRIDELKIGYDTDVCISGSDAFGVYLELRYPLAGCYIIEGWGDWRPPNYTGKLFSDLKPLGTFESCGRTYEVYWNLTYVPTSIDGPSPHPQYWSVACDDEITPSEKSSSKHEINIKDHLEAWERFGLETGSLQNTFFYINGYNSSGYADINNISLKKSFLPETTSSDTAGDANCDGTVDLADAILIMQALANPNTYGIGGTSPGALKSQGAVNGDVDTSVKGLTADDALMIQEYLLHRITEL